MAVGAWWDTPYWQRGWQGDNSEREALGDVADRIDEMNALILRKLDTMQKAISALIEKVEEIEARLPDATGQDERRQTSSGEADPSPPQARTRGGRPRSGSASPTVGRTHKSQVCAWHALGNTSQHGNTEARMDHMLRVSDQEALIAWFNHAQSLLGSRRGHQFDEMWLKLAPIFQKRMVDLWYYASKNKNNKSTVV